MPHKFNANCTEPKSHFPGGLLCVLTVPDHSLNLLPKLEQVQLALLKLESQLPLDCLVWAGSFQRKGVASQNPSTNDNERMAVSPRFLHCFSVGEPDQPNDGAQNAETHRGQCQRDTFLRMWMGSGLAGCPKAREKANSKWGRW